MNRGLVYLLRKRPVGWLRAVRRRTRGAKGVLLTVGVIVLTALVIAPQVAVAMHATSEAHAQAVARARAWAPLVLTLLALMAVTAGRGLLFRPNEIDFLFPAPIGRRELLLYFVLGRLIVIALSSLWFAIFVLRFATHWYAGLVGIFFGMTFLLLLSTLGSLLLATASERFARRVPRLAGLGVLVLVAGGLLLAKQELPAGADLRAAARALAASEVVAVVTAPAGAFVALFTSETAGAFLANSALGLAILLVLFGAIALTDVAYTESALRTSRLVQDRLRRLRTGGNPFATPARGKRRRVLRAAPWLGGAGPIAWRQAVEAMRNLRGIVVMSVVTVLVPVVLVVVTASSSGDARGSGTSSAFGMVILMTVLTNQGLVFDFRRDLDRMAYLKSLPLPAISVALGQLCVGIAVFTLVQLTAIAVLVLAVGVPMPVPAPLLVLLLPFNWLALALDNTVFLLLPYRFAPKEAGNVQFVGRTMLVAFVKALALMLLAGAAYLAGWIAWQLGGRSLLVGAEVAGGVLVVEAAVLTWVLGRVFARFDLTRDVPA